MFLKGLTLKVAFYCIENETANVISQFEENSALCLLKIHKVQNKYEAVRSS